MVAGLLEPGTRALTLSFRRHERRAPRPQGVADSSFGGGTRAHALPVAASEPAMSNEHLRSATPLLNIDVPAPYVAPVTRRALLQPLPDQQCIERRPALDLGAHPDPRLPPGVTGQPSSRARAARRIRDSAQRQRVRPSTQRAARQAAMLVPHDHRRQPIPSPRSEERCPISTMPRAWSARVHCVG